MKIGYDGSRAFNKHRTGTENYSYQLLLHLAKIDNKNDYLVYLRPGSEVDLDKWPKNFKFKTLNYPRFWTQLGLSKTTFSDKLDLLFVPSHTLPLIKRPGLKTVVTVHDLGAEYLPKTHQLKQRAYLKLMTHHQLKSATHLIAVSEATKNDLISKVGIKPQKISVIYEGFNQDLFKPLSKDQRSSILKEFNLEDKNYFLFVGTIQPRKNLRRLIEAYAKFIARGDAKEGSRRPTRKRSEDGRRDTGAAGPRAMPQLVLAGSKGWLSDEIYQLPKRLGIEDQVKFLGYVPDEKLPSLYEGAMAFLFPSLFEGFGLPILEAMSSGTPVITSNTSSMPEVAGRAALLIDPYSTNSIYKSLVQISDLKVQERLRKLGFEQVKKFSWEKCARETLKVFEDIS